MSLRHNLSNAIRGLLARGGVHMVRSRFSPFQLELYEKARPERPRYVNIGAGNFRHLHWHNMDMPNTFYGAQQNIQITHDLTSGNSFPIETCSVEVFYCSHVIEHLPDSSVQRLFEEVFRCLKPSGIFRVTCPDMALHYRALIDGDKWFWKQPSGWGTNQTAIEHRFLEMLATQLVAYPLSINTAEIAHAARCMPMESFFESLCKRLPPDANAKMPEGHCNWFTSDKVLRMLRAAGFAQAWESRYLQSIEPKLRSPCHFDLVCPEESLYVECRR